MTEQEIIKVLDLAKKELDELYKEYAADIFILGETYGKLDELKDKAMKICEKYAVEVKREGEIKR